MRRILALLALLTLVAGPAVTGVSARPATAAAPSAALPGAARAAASGPLQLLGLPAAATAAGINRIVLIVMENHSYSAIINNPAAPYLNELAKKYGLATNYTAVTHPSEPNYLALFTGTTFGIHDDAVHAYSGTSLADQIEAKGLTWRVNAENVPTGCYTGATFYGGPDGQGWYARKHEPAIMSRLIAASPTRCARITDLRHFSLTAANFTLVVPNMCHDMHDCSVATGDAWLKSFVTPITTNPNFAHTLVIVTFDEGTDALGGGGRVATILVGPMVRAAARSAVTHNHYSLLRTIENVWSLGCLRNSCTANDLRELLGP